MTKEEERKLMEQAENETKGMDFTYVVNQITGEKLTEQQVKTKEAVESVMHGKTKN